VERSALEQFQRKVDIVPCRRILGRFGKRLHNPGIASGAWSEQFSDQPQTRLGDVIAGVRGNVGDKLDSTIGLAHFDCVFSSDYEPLRAPAQIWREMSSSLKDREPGGRRRHHFGGRDKLRCDHLIGLSRRQRDMPGAPVRSVFQNPCERPVSTKSHTRRRRPIDRGCEQRMAKRNTRLIVVHQSGVHGGDEIAERA
jgi:hypothetical protein